MGVGPTLKMSRKKYMCSLNPGILNLGGPLEYQRR